MKHTYSPFSYCLVAGFFFINFAVLHGMKEDHLQKLQDSFGAVKNNILKLSSQRNHLISLQKKGNNSIALQQYIHKIEERIAFLELQKKTKELMHVDLFSVEDRLKAWEGHTKNLNFFVKKKIVDETVLKSIKNDIQFAQVQVDSYRMFVQPKNVHQYLPLTSMQNLAEFKPFDSTCKDHHGNNFLMWGIEQRLSLHGLHYLLECGISCNDKDKYGNTVLHKAVKQGPDYVKFMLNAPIELYQLQETYGDLFLKGAYSDYAAEVAKQRITQQTVNEQNDQGDSALHYACTKKCLHSVQLLIQAYADATLKNKRGKTCFDIVCDQPWDEQSTLIAAELLHAVPQVCNSKPRLYELIVNVHNKTVTVTQATSKINELFLEEIQKQRKKNETISKNNNQLIEKKQSTTTKKENKSTPRIVKISPFKDAIKKAIAKKVMKPLQKCIKRNKDYINEQDLFGGTPLYYAAQHNHEKSFVLLLESKADPNGIVYAYDKKCSYYVTPLEFVVTLNIPDYLIFIKPLIDHRADIMQVKRPLLHDLVLKNDGESIIYLLENTDIDINYVDTSANVTPLHVACLINNIDLVRIFLQYKADPNKTSVADGPLDSAFKAGNIGLVRSLLEHGATRFQYDFILNDSICNLGDKDIQESLGNSFKKFGDSILLACKNNVLYSVTDPKKLFWHTLKENSAIKLNNFLKKEITERCHYNTSQENDSFPFDVAYNNKWYAVALMLLMHGINKTKNSQEITDIIFLNEKPVKALEQDVILQIYAGFKLYKDALPVFINSDGFLSVATNGFGLLWAVLVQGNAKQLQDLMRFKDKIDFKPHPVWGYPLDYVLYTKQYKKLTILLENKILTTEFYTISDDTETREALKIVGEGTIEVKLVHASNSQENQKSIVYLKRIKK